MGRYLRAIAAFVICASAGVAVAFLAMAHHGAVPVANIETLTTASTMELFCALLAVAIMVTEAVSKLLRNIVLGLACFATITFFVPIGLLSFGIIAHTPTAPFGGMAFILVWFVVGIAMARKQLAVQND